MEIAQIHTYGKSSEAMKKQEIPKKIENMKNIPYLIDTRKINLDIIYATVMEANDLPAIHRFGISLVNKKKNIQSTNKIKTNLDADFPMVHKQLVKRKKK